MFYLFERNKKKKKLYLFESRDVCLVLVAAHHSIINLMCVKKKTCLFGTIASRGVQVVNFHWWGLSRVFLLTSEKQLRKRSGQARVSPGRPVHMTV